MIVSVVFFSHSKHPLAINVVRNCRFCNIAVHLVVFVTQHIFISKHSRGVCGFSLKIVRSLQQIRKKKLNEVMKISCVGQQKKNGEILQTIQTQFLVERKQANYILPWTFRRNSKTVISFKQLKIDSDFFLCSTFNFNV